MPLERSLEDHEICVLAWRYRSDLAVDVRAAGSLDCGEFEQVAGGEQARQVLLAFALALQDLQVLQRRRRPDEHEEILRDGSTVIGGKTRTNAVVERFLDRRAAMAHCHLDRGRE